MNISKILDIETVQYPGTMHIGTSLQYTATVPLYIVPCSTAAPQQHCSIQHYNSSKLQRHSAVPLIKF